MKLKCGWLVYNQGLHKASYLEQLDLYRVAAVSLGVELTAMTGASLCVSLVQGELSLDKSCENVDFVVFLDKDVLLAEILVSKGLRVFNSPECVAICDNKMKTIQRLASCGIAMPDTVFSPLEFVGKAFYNESFLDKVGERLGFPLVVKEAYGSYGEQVYLATSREELGRIYVKIQGKAHLFQKYISSSFGRDVRLYVVGDCVVGAMLRQNQSDFRANISSGGLVLPYEPSEQMKQLAVAASLGAGGLFTGVDILFGEGEELLLCEVNSSPHIKHYYDCFQENLAFDFLRSILEICNK